jgi:hypothetical protein
LDPTAPGKWAHGVAERSPESLFRSGASPALADLGRPGSFLDKVWPGRKLAACVGWLARVCGGWGDALGGRAGRCGGACRRARVQAARARNVCEQGLCACTVLRQAGNRACTAVQGARHGDLRLRAASGHWRAAVRRCGGLRATTPSAKGSGG